MDLRNEKCVMVLDGSLPEGILANTAALLGITLGKKLPEAVGADVTDQSGVLHLGILSFPVPVLRASSEDLRQLRQRLREAEFQNLTVADFTGLAQGCRTYDEFTEKMGRTPESALQYLGIAICGDRKRVSKLTGSLPLLR